MIATAVSANGVTALLCREEQSRKELSILSDYINKKLSDEPTESDRQIFTVSFKNPKKGCTEHS